MAITRSIKKVSINYHLEMRGECKLVLMPRCPLCDQYIRHTQGSFIGVARGGNQCLIHANCPEGE